MKIIDCFMYFDEDMMLDIRLNILNKYVSNFIICEAAFNHKGLPKKLNFNINNFSKFKNKITYIVVEKQPSNLRQIKDGDSKKVKDSVILDNSLNRENFQRNSLAKKLNYFSDEDLILINDIDEIPNLENFKCKNKITIFKQKMFYYKFNLIYPGFVWFGSKICKKKHLQSPQWLRNIKSKKYPLWRPDVFFSRKKYYDVGLIENGGWHFTNIKNAKDIDHKMRNFLHHHEYEESGMNVQSITKNINEKKVFYNHFSDKTGDKMNYGQKLEKMNLDQFPKYLLDNQDKFKKWFD